MVTFLRRIRQKLFSESRISGYLLYASGEIVLVVIGILLALQINNWNENRIKIKNEKELLTSLETEIHRNIKALDENILANKTYSDAVQNVLKKSSLQSNTFSNEEIAYTFNYNNQVIESAVLDAIIESNSNVLIKRKGIIADLRDLREWYVRIEKSEYYLDELWNSRISDFFISCGLIFTNGNNTETLITMKEIEAGGYNLKQFIALIHMKNDLHSFFQGRLESARDKSKEVIGLLHSE